MLGGGIIDTLGAPLRRRILREVRATISGAADGSARIALSDDAYFAPDTVIRRVHGDVTSMMVGGIAALLLQMLHPAVLAGVWDHSNFREDMLGRLHRTARFIATTTYAHRDDADDVLAHVRAIHDRVSGVLPDGTPYDANDPRLLAWVHVCEAVSFVDAWKRYGRTPLSAAEEDSYFDQFALIAAKLGADLIPRTRAEADALIADIRPELLSDHRTREVAALVVRPRAASLAAVPVQALTIQAAIDLLPPWARALHGFGGAGVGAPLVRAGTSGIARTLRWAFA
ncbi:DUF2236 domain-containing protein [Sphingomonas donggukensis]|uniref:DUF2236 domain-containing protein n=1 Tax=Sphingomonas donggukensis TaxID=2949093 RepID=A0ABY4TVX0_9SPHN|nr:oxygenase MpaB family protein [Sphingomonas donggukensis]URW74473.1 DUF2236 domain-containing protein [Sphingomonas donggukensis]